MEEGKDKIAISCGDILTLSQELSSKDVKYVRLEMRYEMVVEENRHLKQCLEESESARKKAEAETLFYEEQCQKLAAELSSIKAQFSELLNRSQQSEREQLEQAIALLLESNVLLSYLKMKMFMQEHVKDLTTAMLLRGFVEECVPDNLKATVLTIMSKVMLLPEGPKPSIIDNHQITMTGSDATYNENPKE